MMHLPSMLSRFRRDDRGVALMEFALIIPFLMLIFYGGIELTRYMLIAQKLDKSAYALADITNQFPPATAARAPGELSVTQMNTTVFPQFISLMEPYDATSLGSVIVTSLRQESGVPRIKWQIAGGGSYADGQTISAISGLSPAAVNGAGASLRDRTATFLPEIQTDMDNMRDNENMIVSEVFFRYQPFMAALLQGLQLPLNLGEVTLTRRVYTRPREGDLACLPETFVYSPSDC